MDTQSLLIQTQDLIRLVKEAEERYRKGKEEGTEYDFFEGVEDGFRQIFKAFFMNFAEIGLHENFIRIFLNRVELFFVNVFWPIGLDIRLLKEDRA